MKFSQSISLTLAAVGLLFLGACASGNTPTVSTETSPITRMPAIASPIDPDVVTSDALAKEAGVSNQGGQVIESGAYHLELVTLPETGGVHLDFYLQQGEGNHEAIADAKVTAQVQLPDGSQKSLDMTYDAAGKHYAAMLPSTAAGQYNVAILSDIGGKKVNGRFNFTQ